MTKADAMDWRHPTGRSPKTISIVALGPTREQWHASQAVYSPAFGVDEVWSLNKALRTVRADFGFVMDDLVGEARRSDVYRVDLDGLTIPIITSITDQEVFEAYPVLTLNARLSRYPINRIIDQIAVRIALARGASPVQLTETPSIVTDIGNQCASYLHNSIPYMLAYAIFIGVRRIYLFGADYSIEGHPVREADRANAEYWVGMARGLGVDVIVSEKTELLNQNRQPYFYGYGARFPKRQRIDANQVTGILHQLGFRDWDLGPVFGTEPTSAE